jgi:hypothetical protein
MGDKNGVFLRQWVCQSSKVKIATIASHARNRVSSVPSYVLDKP